MGVETTLMLLRHIAYSAIPLRVLIVGTYRDTELRHDHPLLEILADLSRRPNIDRMSLPGLDGTQVAWLIERVAGHALDEDAVPLIRAVYEETEGNPFFVLEVLRHLAESGVVERRDGVWVTSRPDDELAIPEGVRAVVGRRLARLSAETNAILRVAAVIGGQFDLPVLAATGTFDEEELLTGLEEATAARLVSELDRYATRYRLGHALVRATLYDELSVGRRSAIHRRVAEAIETVYADRLDDHLPALAHHYARASGPTPEMAKAAGYATLAGDRALAQLAHDEAVTYYREALELLDVVGPAPTSRRLDALLKLGDAQRRAGEPGYRDTLLSAGRMAIELGDAGRLADAALLNSRGTFSSAGTVDHERVEMLVAAVEAIGETDLRRRARLLATLGLELVFAGDRQRRVRLSDEALALARQLGDTIVLASALVARLATIWDPTTLTERLENSAELIAVAERVRDPIALSWGWWRRSIAAMEAGDFGEAWRCYDAFNTLASESGQPTFRWFSGYYRATLILGTGDVTEAERLARSGFELGQALGQPDAPLFFAMQLFNIRFEQGRLDEMEEQVSAASARLPSVVLLKAMLALVYSEADRLEEARQVIEALARRDFTDVPLDNVWMPTTCLSSLASARIGDPRRCAQLFELLSPYPGRVVSHTLLWLGTVDHYRGILAQAMGHRKEAEAVFAAAAAIHEKLGSPAWLARTRLGWAELLLSDTETQQSERGRRLADLALQSARQRGLTNVERRATAILG